MRLPILISAVFVVGCGPPTSSASDAGIDAATHDAGADDAATQDVTTSVDAGSGCHAVSDSGASEQCSYASSTAPDSGCPITGGLPGSCPSSGLFGCCVETLVGDGGAQVVNATCYYSSTTGQPAESQCSFETYEGKPYAWELSAP